MVIVAKLGPAGYSIDLNGVVKYFSVPCKVACEDGVTILISSPDGAITTTYDQVMVQGQTAPGSVQEAVEQLAVFFASIQVAAVAGAGGGGGAISPEELQAMLTDLGYLRISTLEHYDFDGSYTFPLQHIPKTFITIYVTDGRTSLSSLLPADYDIIDNTVTVKGVPMAVGWWLDCMYTY